MSWPQGIAGRIVVTLVASLTIVWLVGAVATVLIVRAQLEQTLDGGLRETAERILPLVVDTIGDRDGGDLDGYRKGMSDPEGGEYVVYQVRLMDGTVVMRSHDAPDAPFSAPLFVGFASSGPWRIYTTGDGQLFVQVGEDETLRTQALWQTIGAIAFPLALLIPLSALIITTLVRRGLTPLRQLGEEVSARDAANLTPLLANPAPIELVPMRGAINALLARLRSAFESERALAANSAHELRTPIAGSLAQTQRLVEELAGHPTQQRAKWVHETLQRLALLAAKLLELSRADSGAARLAEPIDLLPAAQMLFDEAKRRLGDRLTSNVAQNAQLRGRVDVDAFGIIVRNLLENAERHGPVGGPIDISVGNGFLEVTNAGPVVPAEHLSVLSHRFERGTTTTPGSGLGLAIVESIMQQIGGHLQLQSPGTGRNDGFTARIRLGAAH
jgi:two-component system OmpR family sensor kinase